MEIQHGDLIEQRRGGVDVLRLIASDLAVHGQSGALSIQPKNQTANGWLLFRLGHPVMAFHQGETSAYGLDALLTIENDAIDVGNEVKLYELSMSSLRQTMEMHPESVLHLEQERTKGDSDSWWSTVRLPSSSWRRADRPEELDGFITEPEMLRRPVFDARQSGAPPALLQPGSVYLFDSPDPHPMIEVGVELAERGVALLGLFGLPHASTDITNRLPTPTSYSLFTQRGEFELLTSEDEILRCVESFLWANERCVVLLDGLDRMGNALGDSEMLNLVRSLVDGVRFNDHSLLLTTDMSVFQLPVRHSLMSEFVSLTSADIESWLVEPEGLLDHPLLLPVDEEEERWIDAQLRHHFGDSVEPSSVAADYSMEGGGVQPTVEERKAAVEVLNEVVESWPEADSKEPPAQVESTGSSFQEGRFISEIPLRETENELPYQPKSKKKAKRLATSPKAPQIRIPQRLPSRKAQPNLPVIDSGITQKRSSAVSHSNRQLPDWPEERHSSDSFVKEDLDAFEERQLRASQQHEQDHMAMQSNSLRDSVQASTSVPSAKLPDMVTPQTFRNKARTGTSPLPSGITVPEKGKPKSVRELSSKGQKESNIDEMYERWNKWEDEDYASSTALYNEKGEILKKFKEEDES